MIYHPIAVGSFFNRIKKEEVMSGKVIIYGKAG